MQQELEYDILSIKKAALYYISERFTHATIAQRSAHKAVLWAVKQGRLPPVTTLKCVDCGAQAEEYDHRDYHKKLIVAPVCCKCNKKRGRGLNKGFVLAKKRRIV